MKVSITKGLDWKLRAALAGIHAFFLFSDGKTVGCIIVTIYQSALDSQAKKGCFAKGIDFETD